MLKEFKVLTWDFNSDSLEPYDVLPYFRKQYEERVKNKNKWLPAPRTLEEFKAFVEQESLYRFWSRCEYEMIIHGWPVQKKDYKLDVHEQVMMNIDHIAEILYKDFMRNDVTCFMYYICNKWNITESERLFGPHLGEHIYEKYTDAPNVLEWYGNLDDTCKNMIVNRARELYAYEN